MSDLGPADIERWIRAGAEANPDKPFVISVEDGRVVSYGELLRTVGRIRAQCAGSGIGRGDRVALLAGNSLEHLALYLGTMAAGATICTIHVEMNVGHFRDILPSLAPRLVVYEPGLGLDAPVREAGAPCLALEDFFAALSATPDETPPAALPTDDGVIFFTSGTTAHPKGVVLSYREMLGNGAAAADAFGFTEADRLYDYRSYNWASAQLLALATLSKGATLLMRRRFSRTHFFADIARHGATIAAGNPTVINMLLQGDDPPVSVPTLRFMTSSSAPLLEDEWRRFEARFGVTVVQGYGTSETGWIAASTVAARRFGTVGRPLPYQRLAIVDADGRALADGEIGMVEVGAFDGNAYRQIGADGSVVANATGRILTGDLGFLDREGYLHLTGRARELIIRGGVNISPVEIDNLLVSIAGVAEAATVGVPDPIYGEEVVSYVVPAPGARLAPAEMLAACAATLPPFKAPKHIYLRAALPKTERGKLDRKALVAQWQRENASK
jgi:long-chain acyl-CoA synthetase